MQRRDVFHIKSQFISQQNNMSSNLYYFVCECREIGSSIENIKIYLHYAIDFILTTTKGIVDHNFQIVYHNQNSLIIKIECGDCDTKTYTEISDFHFKIKNALNNRSGFNFKHVQTQQGIIITYDECNQVLRKFDSLLDEFFNKLHNFMNEKKLFPKKLESNSLAVKNYFHILDSDSENSQDSEDLENSDDSENSEDFDYQLVEKSKNISELTDVNEKWGWYVNAIIFGDHSQNCYIFTYYNQMPNIKINSYFANFKCREDVISKIGELELIFKNKVKFFEDQSKHPQFCEYNNKIFNIQDITGYIYMKYQHKNKNYFYIGESISDFLNQLAADIHVEYYLVNIKNSVEIELTLPEIRYLNELEKITNPRKF